MHYLNSVTNANAESRQSDIPVFAGRFLPMKVLGPLEKFPLWKCKRALLMAPGEAGKRDHYASLNHRELPRKTYSPQAITA